MTADDLAEAFDGLPAVWRERLPGWTPAAQAALAERVRAVSDARPIGPPDPFRALRLVAPDSVRVVVFGQDPYPTPGHADGLAFSAGQGHPRSLARVFEVLAGDRPGWKSPAVWRLDRWAEQGVLLLNPALTVELGKAASHTRVGWQRLTSEIVSTLCSNDEAPAFLLWGTHAQRFFEQARVPGSQPSVLKTRHPAYDIHREFMAGGSHFMQTADRIDWWAL